MFLRYPSTFTVSLVNQTDLPARYEMVPQDEASQVIASFRADQPKGVIAARSQTVL